MKYLIIFESKTGVTEDCAKILKEQMPNCDCVNLKTSKPTDLNTYDTILIGSPIYMGSIRRHVKKFCVNNLRLLLDKKVGLFLCGASVDEELTKAITRSFPKELLEKAITVKGFGTELRYERMNFFSRAIMKKAVEEKQLKFCLNNQAINEFILKMKA